MYNCCLCFCFLEDAAVGMILLLNSTNITITEQNTTLDFYFIRVGGDTYCDFEYDTVDGTAFSGYDYVPVSHQMRWGKGMLLLPVSKKFCGLFHESLKKFFLDIS